MHSIATSGVRSLPSRRNASTDPYAAKTFKQLLRQQRGKLCKAGWAQVPVGVKVNKQEGALVSSRS